MLVSQYPHGVSQPPITPVPRNLTSVWLAPGMYVVHTQAGQTLMLMKSKNK